jgi:dTDP-4-dehydrorhamnose reductase
MRILLTGAGGMLGQDLVSAASAAGAQCIPLTHAELDITDAAEVDTAVTAANPDVVVNCAAWTDVDAAESSFDIALAVNGEGAGNVARAAHRTGAHTLHISSDYVFDGTKRTPYVESDPTAPLSGYGRSKLAGEEAVTRAAPGAHAIVRSSWLFGEHGHCFPATILRLAEERDQLTVVDDQVGCPTFTGHLANALLTLCEQRPLGILHVAASSECSWYEFAREIVAEVGADATVTPCRTTDMPRPARRPAYSVLRSERGAPEMPDWRQGLQAYLSARMVSG